MIDAIKQVIAVQNAHGLLKKQEIIEANKDNEDFKKLLYYALNPLLTYKVSEQTLNRVVPGAWQTFSYHDIFEICDLLSSRKAVDDATVSRVCSFLRVQDDIVRDFYIKLLSKTLRLGVTSRTLNKVIPNLIPTWDVQQAYTIEKYPIKDGTWFSLSQKLNGVRATYYKGQLIARSGVPFEGLDHIIECFKQTDYDIVYDGELTLKDKGDLRDNEAFRIATGIINSDEDKSAIGFTVFDALPASEFDIGESTKTYRERRALYLEPFSLRCSQNSAVQVLSPLYQGTDQNKIAEFLDLMVLEDKEGLMANLDTPYKCCRHKGILKIKRFYTMDLLVIRCEEGTGRLAGTLGAIVLDYKGNEVKVGSGFSDEQRAWIWKHSSDVIGYICEVKYKEISEDKSTNLESLQFPVFVSLRTDKDQISYD